jgi:hypothetical protein
MSDSPKPKLTKQEIKAAKTAQKEAEKKRKEELKREKKEQKEQKEQEKLKSRSPPEKSKNAHSELPKVQFTVHPINYLVALDNSDASKNAFYTALSMVVRTSSIS